MFDIVKIILKDAQKSIKKISIIFLLFSIIFGIAIISVDERYTSKSKLLPVGASSSIGKNYNSILQNIAGDITESDPILIPFIYNEILNSFDFIDEIMSENLLIDGKKSTIYEIIAEKYNKDLDDPKDKMEIFETFNDYFYNTSFNTLTNMIELEVNFYSPESSQIINQKTINHLIKAQDNYIKSKNLTEIAYLENQVTNLKKSIESLENSLIEFLNENKDITSPLLAVEYQRRQKEISIENSILSATKINFENQKLKQLEEMDTLYIIEKPSLAVESSYPNVFTSLVVYCLFFLISVLLIFYRKNYNYINTKFG